MTKTTLLHIIKDSCIEALPIIAHLWSAVIIIYCLINHC